MTEKYKMVSAARKPGQALVSVQCFGVENARKVCAFHQSFPEYAVTPLAELRELAQALGVAGIYVKDESYRFGLNAFKVLGGSYAIGNVLAQKLGREPGSMTCGEMTSEETRRRLGDVTFVTATDGNHGRGVAWTANRLKQKSVVYMPKGSAAERLRNIRALDSDASITELNYDDTVRLAHKHADRFGWTLVQDTAWPGYETIPTWIMQGYTTMAYEAMQQLNGVRPTHIFLQAGVGAMAGGLTGFFADYFAGGERPVITIVEPNAADCIYKTAAAHDGKLHTVPGDLNTIMAGLACGEPCSIGWDVLRDYADFFVSMPDEAAAKGMRVLGNPMGRDPRVVSGESGASALGFVYEVLRNPGLSAIKEQLRLTPDSRVLCFSTEGDTDRENYRRVVWDGTF